MFNLCLHCLLQGIDLNAGGRNKRVHRTAPKSENPYVKLLVKVRGHWEALHICWFGLLGLAICALCCLP